MHLESVERTTSKSGHNGQYWSSDGDAGTRGRGRSTPAWARRARVRPGTPRRCTVGTEATGPVADAHRSDSEASQKAKRVLRRRRGRDQEPRSKCPGVRGAYVGVSPASRPGLSRLLPLASQSPLQRSFPCSENSCHAGVFAFRKNSQETGLWRARSRFHPSRVHTTASNLTTRVQMLPLLSRKLRSNWL